MSLDDVIRSASSHDDYADNTSLIYSLYGIVEDLAREVQRIEKRLSSTAPHGTHEPHPSV